MVTQRFIAYLHVSYKHDSVLDDTARYSTESTPFPSTPYTWDILLGVVHKIRREFYLSGLSLSLKAWLDIHKSWIFMFHWYPLQNHYEYPSLDIKVDIRTCMDNWILTSKNHGYPYWEPWNFGNPCMDMLGGMFLLHPMRSRRGPDYAEEARKKLYRKNYSRVSVIHLSVVSSIRLYVQFV